MEASQGLHEDTGQSQQMTDQAREKVGEAADQAKETAQNVASQARERVREQVDQRTTEAGERVSGTAGDIRSVGQELRNHGKEGPAKVAEQAADRMDRAGSYLRDVDADRILNDVEDFGRRRPWAVVAGAMVVGLAAARFLKASSRERYSSRRGGQTVAGGTRQPLSDGSPRNAGAAISLDSPERVATPAGAR
jgi:hypothetical protein